MECEWDPFLMIYVCPGSSSGGSELAVSSSAAGFPADVVRGFADFNEVFAMFFACFLLVRLINMAR